MADNSLLIYVFCTKYKPEIVFLVLPIKEKNNFTFLTYKSTKNWSSNFGLVEELWIFSCTFLAVGKFSCMSLNPKTIFNMYSNCSNLLDMRNFQEQGKKTFYYQKLFQPLTVWINCFSDPIFSCKFSAFGLGFQKFFMINWTIFSHNRSEQFS